MGCREHRKMTTKRKLLTLGAAIVAALLTICLGIWLQWSEGVYTLIAAFVAIVVLVPLFGSKKPK